MIHICCDFGHGGPYVGEMEAVLRRIAPAVPAVLLMADMPRFRPDLAGYLLPSLAARMAPGDVVLAVVDPGVGTARLPLVVEADGIRFVGPDNGLFEQVLRRAGRSAVHRIDWQPPALSASFHGRDLFAPVAARLALGEPVPLTPVEPTRLAGLPDDLDAVVHVDDFGNVVSGRRSETAAAGAVLDIDGRRIPPARTFGEMPARALFWYVNSMGLLEIAANRARASDLLGLAPGDPLPAPASPA